MPIENKWASFFEVGYILSELFVNDQVNDLVEIGCGYGTFTIPSAEKIKGKLYAYDIEEVMIDFVRDELHKRHVNNVILEQRDVLTETTGLVDNSVDYVMLFNIMHHESPKEFLNEAHRILKPQGKLGIIHWRSDIETPRGPDLTIRPKPEEILLWVDEAKFTILKSPVTLKPYHFGLILSKI